MKPLHLEKLILNNHSYTAYALVCYTHNDFQDEFGVKWFVIMGACIYIDFLHYKTSYNNWGVHKVKTLSHSGYIDMVSP